MAKLTLKKLATELNANNIACAIGKNVDKIFLDNIRMDTWLISLRATTALF